MSDTDTTLQIRPSGDRGARVVTLHGEVDLRSSPRLRDDLIDIIDERPQRLIIDLTHVSYMDSSGVGTLVEIKRRLEQNGGKLALAGLQPRVRSVFEITRLDRFFTLAADVNEARKA
jgi:anti-sigma B factor antagonist